MATGQFAPTPRTMAERMAQAQTPRQAEALGARNGQLLYNGVDSAGNLADGVGIQKEHQGRSMEPVSDHFGAGHLRASDAIHGSSFAGQEGNGQGSIRQSAQPAAGASPIRKLQYKNGKPCDPLKGECGGPIIPPPVAVPPPSALPSPPQAPKAALVAPEWPTPPPAELPFPIPPSPSCGDLCDPSAKDPSLVRIPAPPLTDLALAGTGLEADVLKAVQAKIANREGWLRAQKEWLSKASEAADTVRREIEQAIFTRDAVASDLEQLQLAQDSLSIRYKANKLKWAYKDKKQSLEYLAEEFEALDHAKEDIKNRMVEERNEVTILTNTLGKPSQQVQISPKELEEPLKFLDDIEKGDLTMGDTY